MAWVPFGSGWSSGDATALTLNTVFDIEPGQKKIMRIPFSRSAPFKKNSLYDMSSTILPTGTANGTFFLVIVNPLQG